MNRSQISKLIAPALVAAAAFFSLGAQAGNATTNSQDSSINQNSATTTTTTPELSRAEAKDLKTQSNAEYKARKNVAEANHDLNKADCSTELDGAAARACKKSAKLEEKQDKANAKMVHEVEKQNIKAKSQ